VKLDQKNPMHWIACGAVLVVLGLVIYASVDNGGEGYGTFVATLGVVLGAVGLVIMGVQNSRRKRD
jgi:peptidoglycan/LPS O-acetylase OafA/YrhL